MSEGGILIWSSVDPSKLILHIACPYVCFKATCWLLMIQAVVFQKAKSGGIKVTSRDEVRAHSFCSISGTFPTAAQLLSCSNQGKDTHAFVLSCIDSSVKNPSSVPIARNRGADSYWSIKTSSLNI